MEPVSRRRVGRLGAQPRRCSMAGASITATYPNPSHAEADTRSTVARERAVGDRRMARWHVVLTFNIATIRSRCSVITGNVKLLALASTECGNQPDTQHRLLRPRQAWTAGVSAYGASRRGSRRAPRTSSSDSSCSTTIVSAPGWMRVGNDDEPSEARVSANELRSWIRVSSRIVVQSEYGSSITDDRLALIAVRAIAC